MAAGVEPDVAYTQKTIAFALEDKLVIYTDGVVDAELNGSPFGIKRLENALLDLHELGAKDIIQNLENKLCDYLESDDPSDDITILVVHRFS